MPMGTSPAKKRPRVEAPSLTQLQQKVGELKNRRADLAQAQMDERRELQSLEEQLALLKTKHHNCKIRVSEKDGQLRKYDELIK